MNDNSFPRLLADVGGTNVRFGSQFDAGGAISHINSYACADFETLWEAIYHHLEREGLERPRTAAIGIATPVTGDKVRMTNHHWKFSISACNSWAAFRPEMVVKVRGMAIFDQ